MERFRLSVFTTFRKLREILQIQLYTPFLIAIILMLLFSGIPLSLGLRIQDRIEFSTLIYPFLYSQANYSPLFWQFCLIPGNWCEILIGYLIVFTIILLIFTTFAHKGNRLAMGLAMFSHTFSTFLCFMRIADLQANIQTNQNPLVQVGFGRDAMFICWILIFIAFRQILPNMAMQKNVEGRELQQKFFHPIWFFMGIFLLFLSIGQEIGVVTLSYANLSDLQLFLWGYEKNGIMYSWITHFDWLFFFPAHLFWLQMGLSVLLMRCAFPRQKIIVFKMILKAIMVLLAYEILILFCIVSIYSLQSPIQFGILPLVLCVIEVFLYLKYSQLFKLRKNQTNKTSKNIPNGKK